MTDRDHYKGFEKEERFHIILGQALGDCPILKARTIKRIISHVAPEFLEGLFESRACKRELRYIGCGCEESECPHGDQFFEIGQIYESINFNGATYAIKGHHDGKTRIGFTYFEYIDNE